MLAIIHAHTTTQVPQENAVVIGGSGYLGKRLVKQLIVDGHYHVHSLDLTIPPETKRDPSVWSYIQTDITNKQHVMEALRDMDVVFHTASLIPITVDITDDNLHKINVTGTQNIIEACKVNNIKRLIYTSSSCVVLGKNPNKICENVEESESLPDDPLNTYVKTKGIAEKMVLDANNQNGVRTCALRLAGILGGTDNKLMDSFMSSCVIQFTGGESKISWIGVDSAVDAHIVADKRLREETSTNDYYKGSTPRGGNQIAGRAFNISITDQFKISELFQFFAEENGKLLIVLPLWIVKGLVNINVYMYKKTGIIPLFAYLSPACFEFLQTHFTVSTERARKDLGWEEPRPWREVIRELIKEYKTESSLLRLKS